MAAFSNCAIAAEKACGGNIVSLEVMPNQAIKQDAGKYMPSLVPVQAIKDIAEVRAYGNAKYSDTDSWKQVEPGRYIDALLRHALAMANNPRSIDDESGIEHYKHVAANAAFLCELLK